MTTTTVEFARKHRAERKEFTYDFTGRLQDGDSLVESPAPTVELFFIGVEGDEPADDRTPEFGDLDISLNQDSVSFWGNPAADNEQEVGLWAVKMTVYTSQGEVLLAEIRTPGGYRRPIIRMYADPEG